jgi:hypothetical protein
MDENNIEEIIRFLNEKQGISKKILADDFFIAQPEYYDLKKTFEASKYYRNGWKWHQLVRVVLESPEIRQNMYERLLNLILKHRKSYSDYFELKTESGTYHIPNPIADLNRLEILFQQYLRIYQKIINHIHFNSMKDEYSSPKIRGKINWYKTIQKSKTESPLIFTTNLKEKDFVTAENILLILCSEWIYRESTRILQIEFVEPLSDYNRNLLNTVSDKTKQILEQFPFQELLTNSKKFWNLPFNDSRITSLENEAWLRFKNELIYNIDYKDLFLWIEKFRELNIPHVSANTPTKHILESIANLDTVYEAWIFLEFVDYLYEKGILLNFQLKNPNCQFLYNTKVVTFYYERTFSKQSEYTWALEHRPDFTAMIGNEILAVFDAKNYAKSDPISETINKMLAYMTNLDTNFGALIFPYHPKNWDDLNESERIGKIQETLKTQFISRKGELRTITKDLCTRMWDQLPEEYKNRLMPTPHMAKFESTKEEKIAKYHLNQTLCLLRFSPIISDSTISMKMKSLDTIFESIISRIKN